MIEGLDEAWSTLQAESKADYRNLPYGSYKAIGAAQAWSDVFEYRFTIHPPWWHTWWARTIYALAGILLISGLFRWRTREQRKKLVAATQLNKRLQQVDKLKDQFLANTSHELRTPLQGIIGISESLYDDAEKVTPEELRENLAMTISSGKRLNSLVNDLLDFSKLKNFDIHLAQKPVGLHALVDVVLKNYSPLVKGKDLQLINAVPGDAPAAFADENRLQQILYNLVGNAIKFMEKGVLRAGGKPARQPNHQTPSPLKATGPTQVFQREK